MRLPSLAAAFALVTSLVSPVVSAKGQLIADSYEPFSTIRSRSERAMDRAHAAAPTLKAIVPRHIDTRSYDTLRPTWEGTIHYHDDNADKSQPHLYVTSKTTFQHSTVILPQCDFIKSVECKSDGIEIDFNDRGAFEFAKEQWCKGKDGKERTDSLLIVTNSLKCNHADDGVYVYWLVQKLSFEDQDGCWKVKVAAVEVEIDKACDEVHLDWGMVTPEGTTHDGHSWNSDDHSPKGHPNDDHPTDNNPTGNNDNNKPSCLYPSESYLGLPTAPCGPDFDTVLDNKIGFYNPDDDADVRKFAPGFALSDITQRSLIKAEGTRVLIKRGWSFRKLAKTFSNAGKVLEKVIAPVRDAAKAIVKQAVQDVRAAGATITRIVNKVLNTVLSGGFKHSLSVSTDALLPQSDSPFGRKNSYLLFSKNESTRSFTSSSNGSSSDLLDIYCVDCGLRGRTTLAGGISFRIISLQLTRAFVSLSGSLSAGANLGVVASGSQTKDTVDTLVEFAIPGAGFVIPNIVTVGASARLDVTTEVRLTAKGRVLVGADLSIPNFVARLDAVNRGSSGVTGFEPQFNKRLDASGEVSASLAIALPAEIGIGLKIPRLKISKQIGLRNTPRLLATAVLRATTNPADQSNCINGLAYDVGVTNTVYSDFAGSLSQLARFQKLHIFQDCLLFPGQGQQKRSTLDAPYELYARQDSIINSADESSPVSTIEPVTTIISADDFATSTLAIPSPSSEVVPFAPSATSTGTISPFVVFNDFLDRVDNQSFIDTASFSASIQTSYRQAEAAAVLPGFDSISIYELSGNYVLSSSIDGNLILDSKDNAAFSTWSTDGGIIVAGNAQYPLFYYPDEMKATGVSRLRTNDLSQIPKTSATISLLPLNYDNSASPGVYIALDSLGNIFYLVACSFTDVGSKIFIVKDLDGGVSKLKEPQLQYTITGGVIEECAPVALQAAFPGY